VIDHARRQVLHVQVTPNRTASWAGSANGRAPTPLTGFLLYYPSRRQMRPALKALVDFLRDEHHGCVQATLADQGGATTWTCNGYSHADEVLSVPLIDWEAVGANSAGTIGGSRRGIGAACSSQFVSKVAPFSLMAPNSVRAGRSLHQGHCCGAP